MAGPQMVGIRNVVNPFEGAQKALSEAGSIYRQYDEDVRRTAEHNAKMDEVHRINEQRRFLEQYDPNLGQSNRGLTAETAALADAKEAEIVQRYTDAQKRGEEVPDPQDIRKQIDEIRRGLVTQEAAKDVIRRDFSRLGFDPTTTEAYATSMTSGLTSRESLIKQEQDRVKAQQDYYAAGRDAADKLLTHSVNTVKAHNTGLARPGSTAPSGGGRSGTSGTVTDPEIFSKIREEIEPIIGGIPILGGVLNLDIGPTMSNLQKGVYATNMARREAGVRPLTEEEVHSFALEGIDRLYKGLDYDLRYDSPAEVQAALYRDFGTPEALKDVAEQRIGYTGGQGRMSIAGGLPQEALDALRHNPYLTPRPMSEIEKERVQQAFSRFDIPKPAGEASTPVTPARTAPVGIQTGGSSGTSGTTTTTTGRRQTGPTQEQLDEARRLRELLAARDEPESSQSIEEDTSLDNTEAEPLEPVELPESSYSAQDVIEEMGALEAAAQQRFEDASKAAAEAQRSGVAVIGGREVEATPEVVKILYNTVNEARDELKDLKQRNREQAKGLGWFPGSRISQAASRHKRDTTWDVVAQQHRDREIARRMRPYEKSREELLDFRERLKREDLPPTTRRFFESEVRRLEAIPEPVIDLPPIPRR